MKTYQEMNEQIVSILRQSYNPVMLHAALRIEELEQQLLCEETCTWKYDGQDCWETGCDNMFYFTAGGPKEDGINFCPYCGLAIALPSDVECEEE